MPRIIFNSPDFSEFRIYFLNFKTFYFFTIFGRFFVRKQCHFWSKVGFYVFQKQNLWPIFTAVRTNICGEMVTLKLWILGTGGKEIVPRFLLIKFIRNVKHSFWQIKLHKLQIMMENCNYKKRKTGNFLVVQFSRNFAVSIIPRKLKSAK